MVILFTLHMMFRHDDSMSQDFSPIFAKSSATCNTSDFISVPCNICDAVM